jgi:predicted CXXCH cytochrome family protein
MTKKNAIRSNLKLTLEQTGLSKRWPSWLFGLLIILLFLIIPLVSLTDNSLSQMLRSSPLPSDNSWISGPLSSAHQIPELNQNCQACHVAAFEVVQDNACLSCHSEIQQHVEAKTMRSAVHLGDVRCASCHQEHNEPASIVRRDDKLCVGCHVDLSDSVQNTKLSNVGGFGAEYRGAGKTAAHPDFKFSMLVSEDKELWSHTRAELAANPIEQSNLTFGHKAHLDPAGIDSPEGSTKLECVDCHIPDGAGQLMQAISMENNCRSCHSLVFDPESPNREVSHGKPDTVLLELEEFYARQYLSDALGRSPTAKEFNDFVLRRPGQSVKQRTEQKLKLAAPWTKAQSVAQEIFTRTTCKTCHDISEITAGNGDLSWDVTPVRLTKQWLPMSTFDHFSHRTSDCSLCHAASGSEQASDVLMPELAICESCHTDIRSHAAKSPTSCVTCHLFHLPYLAAWDTEKSSEHDNNKTDEISNLNPSSKPDQ